jgi:hypothetical protein
MSRLERTVRPILSPLILSRETSIGGADFPTIARWAVKTAILLERCTGVEPVFAANERFDFAVSAVIPDVTMVFLARELIT